jgi:hypothetical protein
MKPNYHVHGTPHQTKKEFNYTLAIAYGIATELILVFAQYLFLAFNRLMDENMSMTFSTNYMMTRGVYVFLALGIIVYAMFVLYFLRHYKIQSFAYLLVYVIAGAAIEITFYLSISATYQGVYLYSILDKVVGVAMGAIGYFILSKPDEF